MTENTKLDNYILYLAFLTNKLDKFFENQRPYIFCKKGCSKCCQNGIYPFSELEFNFLMIGFNKLPLSTQQEILNKINKIKKETGTYECPFLINNECSVYDYRGIICRSFGLMSINDDKPSKIPFCAFEGLNYSNVLDGTKISAEKFEKLNIENEPLAYNVKYEVLTNKKTEEAFGISFGAKKALIDWFK